MKKGDCGVENKDKTILCYPADNCPANGPIWVVKKSFDNANCHVFPGVAESACVYPFDGKEKDLICVAVSDDILPSWVDPASVSVYVVACLYIDCIKCINGNPDDCLYN